MVRVSIEEAYEILGVGKLSNIEEVKNAYRYALDISVDSRFVSILVYIN